MRKIKFRVWDAKRGIMQPQPSMKFNGDTIYAEVSDDDDHKKILKRELRASEGRLIKVDLMQFAGLKDAEDKDIYEGDIIDFVVFDYNGLDEQHKGVIKFSDGEWGIWKSIESEYYGSDGAFHLYWVHQQDCEMKVIGNIYENPELLEVVK